MVPKSDHLANTRFDKKPPAQVQLKVCIWKESADLVQAEGAFNDSSVSRYVLELELKDGCCITSIGCQN